MRRLIIAAALGVALAGCGAATAAPANPPHLIPPAVTAPTVPNPATEPICTSGTQTGCVPPLCDVIGNVAGCIPDGPGYQGPPPPAPRYITNTNDGSATCFANCDPQAGS